MMTPAVTSTTSVKMTTADPAQVAGQWQDDEQAVFTLDVPESEVSEEDVQPQQRDDEEPAMDETPCEPVLPMDLPLEDEALTQVGIPFSPVEISAQTDVISPSAEQPALTKNNTAIELIQPSSEGQAKVLPTHFAATADLNAVQQALVTQQTENSLPSRPIEPMEAVLSQLTTQRSVAQPTPQEQHLLTTATLNKDESLNANRLKWTVSASVKQTQEGVLKPVFSVPSQLENELKLEPHGIRAVALQPGTDPKSWQWQAPPLAKLPPQQWGQQLVQVLGDKVQLQLGHKIQQAHLRLDPPHLGKIEIHIRIEGEHTTVQLSASHPQVRENMQQQLDQLRQQLGQQLNGKVEVAFNQEQSARQNHRQQPPEQEQSIATNGLSHSQSALPPSTPLSGSNLVDRLV